MKQSLLITGGTGFIGTHLRNHLDQRQIDFKYTTRRKTNDLRAIQIPDITEKINWAEALEDIETVIHLAGRAHVLNETSSNALEVFRQVNTKPTLHLAEQMIKHNSRRLVFVSTIGVNGDRTPPDTPFTENSPIEPSRPYAAAKYEAEQGLAGLQSNLEIVIVRPPLVYGPHAPGNFAQLVRLVESGIPLPLGDTQNRRSLVSVQNLCDFLLTCATHSMASNETFLVSDRHNLSTTDILQNVAHALGRPARLFTVPRPIIKTMLKLLQRERIFHQLFGSLTVDSSKAQRLLGWQPPLSVKQSFAALKANST
jgi:nucleoside-diphosphate-sugar epimerase